MASRAHAALLLRKGWLTSPRLLPDVWVPLQRKSEQEEERKGYVLPIWVRALEAWLAGPQAKRQCPGILRHLPQEQS